MPDVLRVGLVGSGFMGRSHAHAFRAAAGVFKLPLEPKLELLADVNDGVAADAAKALGFARSTGDWSALVADPAVDLVDITAPNTLHMPIALAAIGQGSRSTVKSRSRRTRSKRSRWPILPATRTSGPRSASTI